MKKTYKAKLKELVRKCKENGINVKFVPDKVTEDFVGMNPKAAKSLGFAMPNNTLYIDKNLSDAVKYNTLRHEIIELGLMNEGMRYWPAHKIALRYE